MNALLETPVTFCGRCMTHPMARMASSVSKSRPIWCITREGSWQRPDVCGTTAGVPAIEAICTRGSISNRMYGSRRGAFCLHSGRCIAEPTARSRHEKGVSV
jgi:hypothetical protein